MNHHAPRRELVLKTGHERSSTIDTQGTFTDPRTAIETMVGYVEKTGPGSWAMLVDHSNRLITNIYWNSATNTVYCFGDYVASMGETVSLDRVKQILSTTKGPLACRPPESLGL